VSADEEDFLTAQQIELYGRFGAELSSEELERFFFLDFSHRPCVRTRRAEYVE